MEGSFALDPQDPLEYPFLGVLVGLPPSPGITIILQLTSLGSPEHFWKKFWT